MEDRHFNISVTSGTVIKTLVVLAIAWLLITLHNIVLDILAAIVIASAIEPAVHALRRYKLPRVLAVLLIYLVLFGSFFILFYFFLPSVLEDFATFIASVPIYLDAFTRVGAFDTYANILGVPAPSLLNVNDIMTGVREALNVNGIFSNAFTAASQIFGGFFSFVLIIVFSFYFAVLETGVDDFLRIIAPKRHQAYILDLWKRSQHKIGLWMQGQLILALVIGILVYLGLTILGVKHALVLAVIAGVFEIIPVFGPILSAIPAVIIAFVSGGATLGLLTVALYVIAQQFENHLIYPLVVTHVVGVPPLLVILALIVGGELAGFLGIILSVPMAATLQELARDYESGRLSRSGL
ncbi:AI-2E family transporter [Candidatus Kaiserbacteria bacterium]|nr:AI-2E family transporter [Candidatus Kaiserbacteria bacterium]